MNRRTKIVCTLGPAVDSKEAIAELIKAGMNVARLNCSHGDWETRRKWANWIRELSPKVAPVAILVDLQGPKFRLGKVAGDSVTFKVGDALTVGPSGTLPIVQPEILGALGPNVRIRLGDGDVEVKLSSQQGENWNAKALTGGTVRTRQGVTVVGRVFDAPAVTPKDREDAKVAVEIGADFLALSYVRKDEDITELREYARQFGRVPQICAKIEMRDAIRDLGDIMREADLVMVARGDLGLQMDIEDVPIAQKRIIRMANRAGKPVITATQMLESMVNAARPTRAEATDVANAILDGTDAIMLSGETANGNYPIECVKAMSRIAEKAESLLDHDRPLRDFAEEERNVPQTVAVAASVAQLARYTKPKAILTTTTSGQTARLVSRFRPKTPILCATWDHSTFCQMAVVWGVEAIHIGLPSMTDEIVNNAIVGFKQAGRLKVGDTVLVTAGTPAGRAGSTNLIVAETVE